jgi:hypothetical protein
LLHSRIWSRALLGATFCWGLSATLTIPAAQACGGLFCSSIPVDQAGEKILFIQDGDSVIAHVQIQYQGDAKEFSWVVPVPSVPTLGVGSDALFQLLRNATRPTFQLNYMQEGECRPYVYGSTTPASTTPASTAPSSVSVISQGQVGPYDSAVLQADDPGALKKWLTDNHYVIPAKLDPLLDPYIAGKYSFVALKLTKDRSVGDIQPIVLKYKAPKPGVPIRLTSVAATPNMAVYVWVLGEARAIPENYRHAVIDEARIDWLNNGRNYSQVVTAAMNEAGGQAFVTDYAGDTGNIDLSTFKVDPKGLAAMRTAADPGYFLYLLRQGRFFSPQGSEDSGKLAEFLKRHLAKPSTLANLDDLNFYLNLQNYADDIKAAQITFDPAAATQELQDTIVTPYQDIQTQFKKHPYITQLFTTMSPEQMTQDPTFRFNPDLPVVSRLHVATAVTQCNPSVDLQDAPVYIKLADGTGFYVSRAASGTAMAGLPAAARIEQMSPVGQASLITDNHPTIVRTLANVNSSLAFDPSTGAVLATGQTNPSFPAGQNPGSPASTSASAKPVQTGAFGCTSCGATNAPQPPLSQGAGEGLTYFGLLLGWFGYRRLGKRRK